MTTDATDRRFQLTLTEGQANAVLAALELYMRLGIGQFGELADKMRDDTIPLFRPDSGQGARHKVPGDVVDDVEECMSRVKAMLGYPRNGSHGISHPDNHISVARSHEILKVLSKVVAEARDPNPAFRTVDHDGLLVRYTPDPAPEAEEVIMVPVISAKGKPQSPD